MSKGGFQSSAINNLFCKCGKETSKVIDYGEKQTAIHFTKKGTFWHIISGGVITRTFKDPKPDKFK